MLRLHREPPPAVRHCQVDNISPKRDRVMSQQPARRRKSLPRTPDASSNDLRDWAAIGAILITSSLLVWTPLLI
jgi:hypothetical protein